MKIDLQGIGTSNSWNKNGNSCFFFLQSISKLERFILQTWITSLIISDRQSLDNDKRVSMFYYYLK